ncbi:MAG: zinc ribbon domain-containing protein, partial [Thermoplasmata archaeon]
YASRSRFATAYGNLSVHAPICMKTVKNNRHGSVFKCNNCGYELNADLNASRNIEVLGTSEYIRLLSASQSLRFNETPLMGGWGAQQQAPKL